MKWSLISSSLNGIREYHLIKAGKVLLVMKYSTEQQSVRLKLDKEHEIFLLENTASGLSGQRISFMNAYGVDLGKFSFNPRNQSGQLQINDRQFQYATVTERGNEPNLVVYKKSKEQPLAACNWPAMPEVASNSFEYACLVLGLCWSLEGITVSQ